MMGIAGAILTGAALAATTLMSGPGKAGAVADGADAMRGQFPYAVKLTMTGIKRPDGSFEHTVKVEWHDPTGPLGALVRLFRRG